MEISPIAIPKEYTDLLKGYSDFDPSKYSEKLTKTLAIECFEERILALRKLYLEYENKSGQTSAICIYNIINGITSVEIEKQKKELKILNSEMKVVFKNIGEMLEKYNEIEFPTYLDHPISKVQFLLKKNLISKHT